MKKSYGAEQIIGILRQCDVSLAQGRSIIEICRELGISDAPYYKWRKSQPVFWPTAFTNMSQVIVV